MLKKFRVTVTKSDVETGTPKAMGSLAGAVYGLYKGDTLIDSFTTDENGQFTTGYTSAIRTGQSVKSAPARATCWIHHPQGGRGGRSFIPLS